MTRRTTTCRDDSQEPTKLPEHSTHALAHQFDDLEQQHERRRSGMWIFLATEVMFFGGLFVGYTVYRSAYPERFAPPAVISMCGSARSTRRCCSAAA